MTTATASLDDIATMIGSNRLEEAEAALATIQETDENRPDVLFLRGRLKEAAYDREGALATFLEVIELVPDHTEALFRAALLSDRCGDDEAAMELYERCVEKSPAPINVLINLGLFYEEHGELDRAEACLSNVLNEYPNHHRARHFLDSVESSYDMVYDEKSQREREHHSAILDMPISDFELSVRSRNCLRQMNIKTLGDLLNTSETELLSYKNFGETSLHEIKNMLSQKNLRLGQPLQPVDLLFKPLPTVSGDASVHVNRPIAELELSVRSRKALQRLGVTTIGELTQHSAAELMAIKNFGQTSLDEIKQQLGKFGISLRSSGSDAHVALPAPDPIV